MLGPLRLPCETPHAHPPRESAPPGPIRWVLPATILGSSLGFIDASVVNVALPAMRANLHTDFASAQWVVNGYMLTLGSLILLGGAAGDRYGRRRVFLTGLGAFATASLACALSRSVAWLIAARLAQGLAAALLAPSSLAIIGAAYAGAARGRAIGTWTAAAALTTALGPVLGGWLVDAVGWRSIFLINQPLAAAALWLGSKVPSDRDASRNRSPPPLDVLGAGLAVLALGAACYGLIALGAGHASRGAIALGSALPAALLFLRRQARSSAPMLPLALFARRDFAGANALTLLLYAALGGALFVLPFLLIEAHGYAATQAGAALLPMSAVMGLGSRRAGSLVARFGARPMLMIGPTLAALGFVVLAFSGEAASYWRAYLPGILIVALGMTASVSPVTTAVFDAAPPAQSGIASGINNAAARIGALLAVAALGLAFGGTHEDPSSLKGPALAEAYRVVMLCAAGLAALSAVVAAVCLRRKRM